MSEIKLTAQQVQVCRRLITETREHQLKAAREVKRLELLHGYHLWLRWGQEQFVSEQGQKRYRALQELVRDCVAVRARLVQHLRDGGVLPQRAPRTALGRAKVAEAAA